MKLVPGNSMTDAEARHAIPPDEAAGVFQRLLDNHELIDGLADLRQGLSTSLESDVINQVKTGEWRLVDGAAYRFDWSQFKDKQDQDRWLWDDGIPAEKAKIIVGHAICPVTSFRKEPMPYRKISHGSGARQETGNSGDTGIFECQHHVHSQAMTVELID